MKRLILILIVLMLCACTPRSASSSGASAPSSSSSSSSSASSSEEVKPQPSASSSEEQHPASSSSEPASSSSSSNPEPQPTEEHVVTMEYMTLGETGVWIKENGEGALGGVYNLGVYKPSSKEPHEIFWGNEGIADYFVFLRGIDASSDDDLCFELGKKTEDHYYILFVPVDEDEMISVNSLTDGKVLYRADDGRAFILAVPVSATKPLVEIQMVYGERVTSYELEMDGDKVKIPSNKAVTSLQDLYTLIESDETYYDELYSTVTQVPQIIKKGGSLNRSGRTWIDGQECLFYTVWDKNEIVTGWYAITVDLKHIYKCFFDEEGYWITVR